MEALRSRSDSWRRFWTVGEALWFAFDPAGADVGFENPYEDPNPPEPPPPFHGEFAHPEGVEMVEVDGVLTPLNLFPGMAAILSQCPDRGCGPIRTENGWEWWTATADGYEGYMPMGAHYAGGGNWSWKTANERKPTKPTIKYPSKAEQKQKKLLANLGIIDGVVETPLGGAEGVSMFQVKEQLGSCVERLLAGYFPNYIVDGRPVSIAADARFLKGFSGLIPSAAKWLKPNTAAITLGLYNIHYDTNIVDLTSPTWDALGVIVEELSHGEQFIKMWQSMPDVIEMNSLGGQKSRRPEHNEALNSWYVSYSAASAKAVANGLDSYYGNSYEQEAQANRARIVADLASKYPQQFQSKQKLCP